jgi:hypothetical protein
MPNSTIPTDQALYDSLPQTQFGEGKKYKQGKFIIQEFPPGFIALNQELATGLHPKLEKILAAQTDTDVDIRLAQIASYCSVILDGTYTLAERDKLCFALAGRLEVLRELPSPSVIC